MPKISNLNAKSIIIKFVLKSIILTALSISALSFIFSFAVLKFDLDLIICKYCGYVTCAFSSFIVPTLCLKGFKHNISALSFASIIPIVIFSIANYAFKTKILFSCSYRLQ
jgi:hypothetical protein